MHAPKVWCTNLTQMLLLLLFPIHRILQRSMTVLIILYACLFMSREFTMQQKKGWYLPQLTYHTINFVSRHTSQLSY